MDSEARLGVFNANGATSSLNQQPYQNLSCKQAFNVLEDSEA